MKQLIVKYDGECAKCGEALSKGDTAMYEKSMGIFCPGCAPTDTEEIREYRQAKVDRKADRYETWAESHAKKAANIGKSMPSYYDDYAFITQPGHIPGRDKLIARQERGWEEAAKAREMKGHAASLRSSVRVAGDAEAKREAHREACRRWIQKGMLVDTGMYGTGTVKRINQKTATIENTGYSKTSTFAVDLSWLTPAKADTDDRDAELSFPLAGN